MFSAILPKSLLLRFNLTRDRPVQIKPTCFIGAFYPDSKAARTWPLFYRRRKIVFVIFIFIHQKIKCSQICLSDTLYPAITSPNKLWLWYSIVAYSTLNKPVYKEHLLYVTMILFFLRGSLKADLTVCILKTLSFACASYHFRKVWHLTIFSSKSHTGR